MKSEEILRKVQSLMNLAGSDPKTPEQKEAYAMAQKLLRRVASEANSSDVLFLDEPQKKKTWRDYAEDLRAKFSDKVQTVRKMSWFEVVEFEYVKLKVVPDSSVRNWRTEDIMRTIADQFRLPIDRLITQGFKVTGYRVQERACFEMCFKDGTVNFFFYVPKNIAPLVIRRLQSVWDKATVEQVFDSNTFNPDITKIYESVYRKHDMYSLHTDSKDNLPLGSLLEGGRLVGEGEKASVFAYFDPIHQVSWNYELNEAWTKLRGGKVPRKWNASGKEIFKAIGVTITTLMSEIMGGLSEIVSSGKSDNVYVKRASDPDASSYAIDKLSDSTKSKINRQGVKTYLWTLVESEDESRADLIARTISMSFSDLSGDNDLEAKPITNEKKKAEVLRTVETKKPPRIKIRSNTFSTAEAGKLIQLPGLELQEQYKEIERISQKEIEIKDKNFFKDSGLLIGESTFKGQKHLMYQPTHDEDETCLPHVGIGGMGQGKTRGLLANYLLEFQLKGFGGCAIDPAKGQIGDEIQHAVNKGVISGDDFRRYNLGVIPFALDFCEALHDERAMARLANIVVYFFDVAEDTTGQTERFLRAAVLALETGRIAEIMCIFEEQEHLDKAIKRLEAKGESYKFATSTLKEYDSYTPAMRRKILSPIYNRINDIMGDPFLVQCMNSSNSIDFVEILDEKKIFVFDVLTRDLDKVAIDVIVSLLSLKIDLAMRMREKVNNREFPFLVAIDEPHQFSKSTKIWQDAVVESRKYRISYFFAFHYWEQIPPKLQKAIRSALPHYHLYPSTSITFDSLRDEMYPFTKQEALKLKRWHAINIIRTGGENATPFIAQMAAPPSKRFK